MITMVLFRINHYESLNMSLANYRTLGKSGLVVSPLALGTMTFGMARWGSDTDNSRAVFNAYVDQGGNFVDTANVYSAGRSEEIVGSFMSERGLRDQMVLATKAGFSTSKDPHSGGNGAKHLHAAINASLRRLQTDYVDLFWVHVWDANTPAHELVETMSNLQRSGKTRYWGISNAPAWYVAQVASIAASRNVPGPVALQYFYSLVDRTIEDEHVPLAREFGMGILPWSPLASGLLTGKYNQADNKLATPNAAGLPDQARKEGELRPEGDKRLDGANPFGNSLFTKKNWNIVDVLRKVAMQTGQSCAQVALSWVLRRPGVTSTLIGASRPEQVTDNALALKTVLAPEHIEMLDAVSAPEVRLLYQLFSPALNQQVVYGGSAVNRYVG